MKVAFQMDPITNVDPKADSTFRIAEEAQLRGHLLFYYEPDKLTSENGKAIASGHFFKIIGKPSFRQPSRERHLSTFKPNSSLKTRSLTCAFITSTC